MLRFQQHSVEFPTFTVYLYFKNICAVMNANYKTILQEYFSSLIDQNTGKKVTLTDIANYLGLSRASLDNHLKKKKIDAHLKSILAHLYMGYNIPLDKLGINKAIIFDTPFSPSFSPVKEVAHLEPETSRLTIDYNKFEKEYGKINRFINKAKSELLGYDYLRRFNTESNNLEHLEIANKKIFQTIETALSKNKSLKYKHLIALPFSIDTKAHVLTEDQKNQALNSCLYELFSHIVRCIKHYEEQVEFYILPTPSRWYDYLLVDNKYIISVDFIATEDNIQVPDMLLVAENDDLIQTNMKKHQREIKTRCGRTPSSRSDRRITLETLDKWKKNYVKSTDKSNKKADTDKKSSISLWISLDQKMKYLNNQAL